MGCVAAVVSKKTFFMAGAGEAASANLDAEASSESGASRSYTRESLNYPSLRIQVCPNQGIFPYKPINGV